MCILGWISRSHARNGNESQTSGHRGLAGKIEKLGFLIPVNAKHAWKSWNLAWCHDMAPTCCGNFSVRFAKAHTLTISKIILEQVLSRYKLETQVLLKLWTFYLPITCRHASLFLLAGRCRVGWLFEYGRHAIRPLRVLIGRRALWPLPAVHLPPNVSINGAWAPVLRHGYMSHWTEI